VRAGNRFEAVLGCIKSITVEKEEQFYVGKADTRSLLEIWHLFVIAQMLAIY
jgi:hypothetical protein